MYDKLWRENKAKHLNCDIDSADINHNVFRSVFHESKTVNMSQ